MRSYRVISQPRAIPVSVYVLIAVAIAPLAGCADPNAAYWRVDEYYLARQTEIESSGPQVEQGRPIAVIDGLNHYVFSLPTKLLLWNWQALDHRLPDLSRSLLERYIEVNRLSSVKVRHNQYSPLEELGRLRRNRNIGAGYRYTLGLLNWLLYSLFPGRLFAGLPLIGAGDHFNPFTNTINVYSSDPTILVHEGAHAKDYIGHARRGSAFVVPRMIPGMDLIQEATASNDAIHFLQCLGDREVELRAYKTLYPAYSTYVAGYVPGGPLISLPVVAVGHAVGRIEATMRRSEIEEAEHLRAMAEALGEPPSARGCSLTPP